MPKICYVTKRFGAASKSIIDQAIEILEEYARQGYIITLRSLYYQFVARDLLPNNQKSYSRLGDIISDARLAGLIDWNHLIDRTRRLVDLEHFADAKQALKKLAQWYHVDFWENQEFRPEVWIEKDALVGVIEGVCQELDVPFFSCRGYTSQSEMWKASQRLMLYVQNGQSPVIMHFGDHDPSGKDMSRDIKDRLNLFMGRRVQFNRLALNMDQIEEYEPPPNPAKVTDSRAKAYIEEFGSESWELDALEPTVLAGLIRSFIDQLRDQERWDETEEQKEKVRTKLVKLAETWK